MTDLSSDQQRVLTALDSPKWQWRTIDGISAETGLEASVVQSLLSSMPDLVIQSTIGDGRGRALFMLRQRYGQKVGGLSRLKNIFRAG